MSLQVATYWRLNLHETDATISNEMTKTCTMNTQDRLQQNSPSIKTTCPEDMCISTSLDIVEDVVGYVQSSVLAETENGTECLVMTQTKRTNGFSSHDIHTSQTGIQSDLVRNKMRDSRKKNHLHMEHRHIFESVLRCTPLDGDFPGILDHIVLQIFVDGCRNWTQVYVMMELYIMIAKRIVTETPSKFTEHMDLIKHHIVKSVKLYCGVWIAQQGGLDKMTIERHEKYSWLTITDGLVCRLKYFLIITVSNKLEHQLAQDISYGLYKGHSICAIVLNKTTTTTIQDELQHFARLDNVLFVPFMTEESVNDKASRDCYHVMCGHGNENDVIPLRLFGLDKRRVSYILNQHESIEAFPKKSFHKSDVRDFVGVLKDVCVGRLGKMLEHVEAALAPKTDKQLDIVIKIKVKNSEDLQEAHSNITAAFTTDIGDPWSIIRQHFLHMYKIKNIRISESAKLGVLTLEIVSASADDVNAILASYKSRKLNSLLTDNVTHKAHKVKYTLTLHIDETKAAALVATLTGKPLIQNISRLHTDGAKAACLNKRPSIAVHTSKHSVNPRRGRDGEHSKLNPKSNSVTHSQTGKVAKTAHTIDDARGSSPRSLTIGRVSKDYIDESSGRYPYDLYSMLLPNKDKVRMSSVLDESGRNLLHMIVSESRPEFFKSIFYLGVWDEHRLEIIDAEKDPQYGYYTPQGLAEKFLFKAKGPKTFEEFQYFDDLWMTMPFLHKACMKGNLRYVKMLLARGDDIHKKDSANATCILYACAGGFTDVVQFLIDSGSDPKLSNARGENGLMMAAKFGKSSVVKTLLSRSEFSSDDKDVFKNRALDYAAMNGDLDTMSAFSNSGMPLDDRVVAVAAKYKRHAMVEELLTTYKLGLSGRDNEGRTPLLNAASKGQTKMLDLLLAHGADLEERDNQNRNVLHLVAESNQADSCQFLLNTLKERNILHKLLDDRDMYNGRDQLLVVRGRDRGNRAWHYISIKRTLTHMFKKKMNSGQIDVKHFGRVVGSGYGQSPPRSFLDDQEDEMTSLLKKCSPDMTPLAMAAYKDHHQIALMFIEAGAKVNVADHFGCAPLHLASMRGNMTVVRRLESHKAQTELRSDDGQTPLDVAEKNEHMHLLNFFNGLKQLKNATDIQKFLQITKARLSDAKLGGLRSTGQDIRLHLVETLRDLQLDINQCLKSMGSGPIEEESSSGHKEHHSAEFAGTRPLYTKLASS